MNVDGHIFISKEFGKSGELLYIRKNRNNGIKDGYQACQYSVNAGVDLNRNYGYKWGYSDSGSSINPCAEDYRGPIPFSEPETRNIKNFMEAQ